VRPRSGWRRSRPGGRRRISPAAERAALALAEAATRLADRPDPVPDGVWDAAADHYDEKGLAAIVLMIAVTNLFNRLNATTRQIAGAWG
jgi:alkylhydroperoxidase family enzyme